MGSQVKFGKDLEKFCLNKSAGNWEKLDYKVLDAARMRKYIGIIAVYGNSLECCQNSVDNVEHILTKYKSYSEYKKEYPDIVKCNMSRGFAYLFASLTVKKIPFSAKTCPRVYLKSNLPGGPMKVTSPDALRFDLELLQQNLEKGTPSEEESNTSEETRPFPNKSLSEVEVISQNKYSMKKIKLKKQSPPEFSLLGKFNLLSIGENISLIQSQDNVSPVQDLDQDNIPPFQDQDQDDVSSFLENVAKDLSPSEPEDLPPSEPEDLPPSEPEDLPPSEPEDLSLSESEDELPDLEEISPITVNKSEKDLSEFEDDLPDLEEISPFVNKSEKDLFLLEEVFPTPEIRKLTLNKKHDKITFSEFPFEVLPSEEVD